MCEEEGSIRSFFGAVDGRVVLTNIFVDVDFLAYCSHVFNTQWLGMWVVEELRLILKHNSQVP